MRAVEYLQQVFGYRNAHIFPDRVFILWVRDHFDEEEGTKKEFQQQSLNSKIEKFSLLLFAILIREMRPHKKYGTAVANWSMIIFSQHPASSIQHPASSIQHPASSIQHLAHLQHISDAVERNQVFWIFGMFFDL